MEGWSRRQRLRWFGHVFRGSEDTEVDLENGSGRDSREGTINELIEGCG